jgi:hypothetical protein
MKIVLTILTFLVLSFDAFAFEPKPLRHTCEISYQEQIVDPATSTQSFLKGKSDVFEVSRTEKLENTKRTIEIKDENGEIIKKAEVNTGTYLESSEGDIVQAYASMEILGKKEDVGVIAYIQNKFSRSNRAITAMNEGKLHAINFNLKCSLVEQDSEKNLEKSKIPD